MLLCYVRKVKREKSPRIFVSISLFPFSSLSSKMLRTTFSAIQRRGFSYTPRVLIAEGDTIPNIQVQLKSPGETVQTHDLFKGKKSILFGTV